LTASSTTAEDPSPREGVLAHQPTAIHLLLITLRNSEALFSPTGQRTIHHEARGSRVLLFGREQRKQGGVIEPFRCLGFATYESHEGGRIWFVQEWRSAGGWSGRSRRRGCR
jgi:hypothetical protein